MIATASRRATEIMFRASRRWWPPMCDPESVERGAAEVEDAGRFVGEEPPRVLVALRHARHGADGPVGGAAAVGLEQAAAQERAGVQVDDLLLSGLQHDWAGVSHTGAVLREDAGPVLGTALDLDASLALDMADGVAIAQMPAEQVRIGGREGCVGAPRTWSGAIGLAPTLPATPVAIVRSGRFVSRRPRG